VLHSRRDRSKYLCVFASFLLLFAPWAGRRTAALVTGAGEACQKLAAETSPTAMRVFLNFRWKSAADYFLFCRDSSAVERLGRDGCPNAQQFPGPVPGDLGVPHSLQPGMGGQPGPITQTRISSGLVVSSCVALPLGVKRRGLDRLAGTDTLPAPGMHHVPSLFEPIQARGQCGQARDRPPSHVS
jgi:hypothetical protein